MVDIHSHILPGVDDGARTVDDSIEMCRMAAQDGVDTIVATPHAHWAGDVNGEGVITAGVDALQEWVREQGIDIAVVGGCEAAMEPSLVEKLRLNRHWCIAGAGRYLLLEPPWGPLPEYCFSLLDEMVGRGITPIIAHPERSPDIQKKPGLLKSMVEMGCLTQVTANSLLGNHGKSARRHAWNFIEVGLAHIVASDSHNVSTRSPRLTPARSAVEELYGRELGSRLFEENPRCVVDGKPISKRLPETARALETGGFAGLFRRITGR